MSHYSIDFNFIAKLEGGPATCGYVPDAGSSRSGVTIGTGFDLGQRKLTDLQALSLPNSLCERLCPYLGIIGKEAVLQLAKLPLTITPIEAALIDDAFQKPFIINLAASYAKSGGGDFSQLPAQIQTVIASVAFQYGNLASRTPNFWQQVVNHDWNAAHANLLNFGDSYSTRRHQEAALIAKVLT